MIGTDDAKEEKLVDEFINEITIALTSKTDALVIKQQSPLDTFLISAISEIIGWSQVKAIDPSLTWLVLDVDVGQEFGKFELEIKRSTESSTFTITSKPTWDFKVLYDSWRLLLDNLQRQLNSLQRISNELKELKEANVTVLGKACTGSIDILIDRGKVLTFSIIQRDGVTDNVDSWYIVPLDDELLEEEWDHYQSILSNIQTLLPKSLDICAECAICYDKVDIQGRIAMIICPNCDSLFHSSCCRVWMQSDPNSKTLFGNILGKCLACEIVELSIPLNDD